MKKAIRIRVFNTVVFKAVVTSTALAVFALPGIAQSADAAAPATSQSINQRKENQQDRIANGVKSGELTAGETTNLEKKESSLNQEERDMRKLDNGKLTSTDKSTLNQQQNKLSVRSMTTNTTRLCRTPTPKAKWANAPKTSRIGLHRASRAAS